MEWMILPLKRYFDFRGRSRRKEYWMYLLFTIICGAILSVLDEALGLDQDPSGTTSLLQSRDNGVLSSLFSIATLVPSIAVAVRRLHDTNRRGWWILLPLLPFLGVATLALAIGGFNAGAGGLSAFLIIAIAGVVIGLIVLLVLLCTEGTRGPNRFGDDPKDPVGDVAEVFR